MRGWFHRGKKPCKEPQLKYIIVFLEMEVAKRESMRPLASNVPEGTLPHMEVHMELIKKTTILFSEELHARLTQLATQEGVSLGELVRRACEYQYGFVSDNERVAAVRSLAQLALPVSDTRTMKEESSPNPDALLP